jgi:hypothetical protein
LLHRSEFRTGCTWLSGLVKRARSAIAMTILIWSPLLLLALSQPANASTAWGSINNFDAVNDTGVDCHGFEIEIEGIHSADISYTYDWNHYGVPKISQDISDPLRPRVFVRYESAKNPDGTWAAFTSVPAAPILPTDGHQFTNPSVNFGGEHFGVGFMGTPPTAVKYNWLKDDGTGHLVYAGAVNIATPSFTYNPPAAVPAQVVAAIVPPPPPAPPVLQFGPACWVKATKTQSHNNRVVLLRDLVSDDPADPNDRNWQNGEPDEVEVEWRTLQTNFAAPDGGANGELVGAPEELPGGDEVITRRYDFFKYVGPMDAETGEAMATAVGPDGLHGVGEVTYADYFDFGTGEWHTTTVDLSTVEVVGDYIGAQMAGFDAAAKIGLIDHLQDGEKNLPYVERTIVIGGTAPVVTTRTGPLPDGMSFDEVTGVLSGTPTASGTFTFTIHSTDSALGDLQNTYTLTILDPGAEPPPHANVTTYASPAEGGSTTGDGDYPTGTTVTVVATANPGFAFASWTETGTIVSASPSYEFIADVNRDLIANFVQALDVAQAKAQPDGVVTAVAAKPVSAVFSDGFYLEESNRSSGIQVAGVWPGIALGTTATVTGTLGTAPNGERFIQPSFVAPVGSAAVPPVGLKNVALGGGNWFFTSATGTGQQGIAGASGLNNIGLLIRTWGAFHMVDASTFTLDDGGGVSVKCVVPASVTLDPNWRYVGVTGISSCYKEGIDLKRLLRVRSLEDIRVL